MALMSSVMMGADHSQKQAVLHIAHEAAVQNGLIMLRRRRGGGEHMQRVGEQLSPDGLKELSTSQIMGKITMMPIARERIVIGMLTCLSSHQVSPPLLTLNWAKAIRAKMIHDNGRNGRSIIRTASG
ncbi:MAG: hypothetical protein ACLRYE_03020 [Gemmiger formicilis]|uniref:hypothetical protein n=1 Tax=Gemmiger formicilis TaxID=745368 RepID=UPI0039A1CD2F